MLCLTVLQLYSFFQKFARKRARQNRRHFYRKSEQQIVETSKLFFRILHKMTGEIGQKVPFYEKPGRKSEKQFRPKSRHFAAKGRIFHRKAGGFATSRQRRRTGGGDKNRRFPGPAGAPSRRKQASSAEERRLAFFRRIVYTGFSLRAKAGAGRNSPPRLL